MLVTHLPFGPSVWRRLGVFRLGAMANPAYARDVFKFHLAALGGTLPEDAVCVEIGPGDSLFTAVNAAEAGFAKSYLIDAGEFAGRDPDGLKLAALEAGLSAERVAKWTSFDEALSELGATYLTDGVESLRSIPSGSVHFVFSHAVLEHIRRSEYRALLAELKRVMAPGGITSHQVDLRDHLGGGLNNLRFDDSTWESSLFSKSGFYTNRISFSEHLRFFEGAGLVVTKLEVAEFERTPIGWRNLARQFRDRSSEDLRVMDFHIVATCA